MPRAPLPLVSGLPYHVTARANNREHFFLPKAAVWRIFKEKLARTSEYYGIRIWAFVLMTNHYHLLLDTPDANLGNAMNYFQREVSKAVSRMLGRTNHVFGGTYKGCLIQTDSYLWNVYKYVYRNPVEAGLAKQVEDYPYSTLCSLFRGYRLPFDVRDDLALKLSPISPDLSERLEWLNQCYAPKQREAIRRGLRRTKFTLPKGNGWKSVRDSLATSGKVAER